jgi:hypothetical protein
MRGLKPNDAYLTKEIKARYMVDFMNVLSFDRIELWKLDAGLPDVLSEINRNEYIQTLYSKKCSLKNPENGCLSYLEFCYSEKVELRLFRILIPSLFYDLGALEGTKFYYDFNEPKDNPNHKRKENVGLGYLDDENYFRINTIRFSLESYLIAAHQIFWDIVKKKLSSVKP